MLRIGHHVLALAIMVTGGLFLPGAAAQENGASIAALGLPEIAVTFDGTLNGVPASLGAGRYLVTLRNQSVHGACAGFLSAPPGQTATEFIATFPSPAAEGTLAASPAAATSLLSLIYDLPAAGGPCAPAGGMGRGIVDLPAGEWVVWSDDPAAPIAAPLTVTGEMPAELLEPEASATLEMADFSFALSMPLTRGAQTVKVVNAGAQPHLATLLATPSLLDMESLMALIAEFESATPEAGEVPIVQVAGSATQSPGTTSWVEWTVDAGPYMMTCFVPDQESGTPHAFMGMISFFEIE